MERRTKRKCQPKRDYQLTARGDGTWLVRKRHGKIVIAARVIKAADERAARVAADQWYADLTFSRFGETQNPTIEMGIKKYVADYFGQLRPRSRETYLNAFAVIHAHFGAKRFDEVEQSHIDAFVTERLRTVSPRTAGYAVKRLHALFELAIMWSWTKANPVKPYLMKARRSKSAILDRTPRTRYLSHDEELSLLKAIPDDWWRSAVIFAIETGLRKSEQFSLPTSQVDLKKRRVWITPEQAKGKRGRYVPLTPRALRAIADMLSIRPSDWLCPQANGQPYAKKNQAWESLQVFCARAGIDDLTWHDLRRTCGCRLIQDRDFRLEDVQVWLGHSSIVETERSYAFLTIDQVQRRLEASIYNSQKLIDVSPTKEIAR